MITQSEKNTAVATHLSSLAKYLIPFAGIVVPIIIWQSKKNNSDFIDKNGRSVINFNLSILLYSIILVIIGSIFFVDSIIEIIKTANQDVDFIPIKLIVIASVFAFILITWSIIEFILIIVGTLKATNGEVYKYPLTIPFIK
ncbi:MAG: DUF4870 domain-containing protein [Flavobacteriaceae bacterium]|jgi:uncharacterized Tic20 family protein|nr:DUF4870 domain-containing protein [Flavobacteriaceae bacterium]